jgi:hypothetical protein
LHGDRDCGLGGDCGWPLNSKRGDWRLARRIASVLGFLVSLSSWLSFVAAKSRGMALNAPARGGRTQLSVVGTANMKWITKPQAIVVWRNLLVFLILVGFHAAACAGQAAKDDPNLTRPGRIDEPRFQGLLAAEAVAELQRGDQVWRKRDYKAAAEAYAKFAAQQGSSQDARIRAAVPYALMMEGFSLHAQRRREDARARWNAVLKDYPQSQDAVYAAYQAGLSYWEDGDEAKAQACFAILAGAPERCGDAEMLFRTYRWLKDYYGRLRRTSKPAEEQWLKFLNLVVLDSRASSEEYTDLRNYYRDARDWEDFKRVLGLRMSPAEAEAETLKGAYDGLEAEHKQCATAPEKLEQFRARVGAALTGLSARVDAVKTALPAAYPDLAGRRLKAYCLFGFGREAGEALLAWRREQPDDRVLLYALHGYLAQGGTVDAAAYDAACGEYLKAHPQDSDLRDLIAKTYRDHFKAVAKGVAVLTAYRAEDFATGEFWQGLDDAKAAPFFLKAHADARETPERQQQAAWGAAECLRRLGRHADALPMYKASAKGAEALHGAGECHAQLGQWKEAATCFLDAVKQTRNRQLRWTCQFRAAELLLEHQDPLGGPPALELVNRGDAKWSAKGKELCEKYQVAIPKKTERKKTASPDDIP